MKNNYIVANPLGVFLVKCHSMVEVKLFIETHLNKCKDSYQSLMGRVPSQNEYRVVILDDLPTYKEMKKFLNS